MNKLHLLIIALVSLLGFGYYYTAKQNLAIEKKLPGSYEALKWWNYSRAYPEANIDPSAYTRGFENHRASFLNEKNKFNGAEWEAMGPYNTSGRTLTIAVNPLNTTTIYAGSASGGLWRSRNLGLGVSWEYVETGFPVLGVSTIAFAHQDSMTMYIGTGEVYNLQSVGTDGAYRSTRGSYGIGILKSEDGGETWKKSLDWSYNQQEGIWMVKVDPLEPKTVYAATTDGIYKSQNAGETWEQKFDVKMGTDIEIDPSNTDQLVASFGNFGSDGKGIYFSENGGDTWEQSTFDQNIDFEGKILLDRSESNPNLLYASIGNGFTSNNGYTWLLKSENGGKSWITVNETDYSKWQGWFSHDLVINPKNPEEIITVGIEVYKSENGGISLEQRNESGVTLGIPPVEGPDGNMFYVHSDIHFVDYHPEIENLILIGTDGGVFLSFDGATTFRSANGGYQSTQFYNGFSVSHSDPNFALGGLQDNATSIYLGSDAWQRALGGDGSWTAINQDNDSIIYVSAQNLVIFKSEDKGLSFSYVAPELEQNAFPLFISPYMLAPTNPEVIYTGTAYVHKSTDGGTSWQTMNDGKHIDDSKSIFAMDVSSQNEDVVYVATVPFLDEASVFITEDGGETWNKSLSALPNRIPNDLAIDPSNDDLSFICFSGFGTSHLFYSSDKAITWTKYDFGLPDVPGNAIALDSERGIIYYGTDIAIYYAKYIVDGEFNILPEWKLLGQGMPMAAITLDLKISPTDQKLWAATHGNGAYRIDLINPLVNVDEEEALNLAVFPNPTSNYINIETEEIISSWTIRDQSGRFLKNGVESKIDVQNYVDGIYYLEVQINNSQKVIKVVVSH